MFEFEVFDITFKHPLYFGLLVLILILIIIYIRSYRKGISFLFYKDLKKIYSRHSRVFYVRLILIVLIFLIFIIILADPNLSNEKKSVNNSGVDIVVDMDVSYSMMAVDFKPNRMEVAKKVINEFVDKLKTDRMGLTVFAGKPFASAPLTFDYDFLKEIISETTVDTINQNHSRLQGTAIGDSILSSLNLFKDSEDREKVIILITDGEANVGIDPNIAAKYAKDKGVKIYTIGVGSLQGGYIEYDTPFGKQHQKVSGLDEKTLKNISDQTNGKYYRATDKRSMEKIFDQIGKLEKKDIEMKVQMLYKPFYKPFVYSLIFLSILYFTILSFYYLND